jgi:uncharacterized protein (TIGR03435 family)
MGFMRHAVLFSFLCASVTAQTPTFEVASVKRHTPDKSMPATLMRLSGGPGTPDPEQLTYTNVPLGFILVRAFDIQGFQPSGPDWLLDARYDILAKIAPGTSKARFNLMLQNLFAERFGMKIHHEKRELSGYELVVGKGGTKMTKSGEPIGPPAGPEDLMFMPDGGRGGPIATIKDKNGLMELAPGRKGRVLLPLGAGRMRISARLQSIADIVSTCQRQTGQPVVDKTGLTGIYDFNLDFSPNASTVSASALPSDVPPADIKDEGGAPFLVAIQSLGLRLQPVKTPVDVVVIDYIEKVPTEN